MRPHYASRRRCTVAEGMMRGEGGGKEVAPFTQKVPRERERDKMMEAGSAPQKKAQTAFVCLLVCVLASNELLIV